MLQLVTDGLIVGSIIALGAIGVTLTYSLLRFANFAHGELLTWGAYLALSFLAGFLALAGAPMRPLGPFSFGWRLRRRRRVSLWRSRRSCSAASGRAARRSCW
jgi:branched-chain amino acid transport system permease protein